MGLLNVWKTLALFGCLLRLQMILRLHWGPAYFESNYKPCTIWAKHPYLHKAKAPHNSNKTELHNSKKVSRCRILRHTLQKKPCWDNNAGFILNNILGSHTIHKSRPGVACVRVPPNNASIELISHLWECAAFVVACSKLCPLREQLWCIIFIACCTDRSHAITPCVSSSLSFGQLFFPRVAFYGSIPCEGTIPTSSCSISESRGPLAPKNFLFRNHAVFRQFQGKNPILSKIWP